MTVRRARRSYCRTDVARTVRHVQRLGSRQAPELFLSTCVNDEGTLRRYCDKRGIRLVERKLPQGIAGMAVDVNGYPVVVLDPDRSRGVRLFVLAHEIAHVVLSHTDVPNMALAYSDTICGDLQHYYCEQEQAADLAAMLMLIPDRFLERVVREKIFIPTRWLAHRLCMRVRLIAARIEVYRLIFGYELSSKVARASDKTDVSLGAREVEMAGSSALTMFLSGIEHPLQL